jgi:hypothetical protein
MATSTYLSNPALTVNAVDLSDQCTSATLTNVTQAQNASSFRVYGFVLCLRYDRPYFRGRTIHVSYAASETYDTLGPCRDPDDCHHFAYRSWSSDPYSDSTKVQLTNCYLAELPLIDASLGELSSISLTFQGGTLTTVTS